MDTMKPILSLFLAVFLSPFFVQAQKVWNDRPSIPLEKIEWCRIWIEDADEENQKLPRVLMIGDSITASYYPKVGRMLKGKARIASITGSRCVGDPVLLKETELILSQYQFDVIHFNNGIHGDKTTEEEYKKYLPEYVATIKRLNPKAKLIWGRTTPLRNRDNLTQFDPKNKRMQKRNEIADEIMRQQNIPTSDLYGAVEKHPDFYAPDGTHMNREGIKKLSEVVTEAILKQLK